MKKILLVAGIIFAVWITGEKANAFEIDGVITDGEQAILQTTYGGDIYLTRGQNAVPVIIEVDMSEHSASIREWRNKSPKFLVNFLRSQDFRAFVSFLDRMGDEAGACYSGKRCSVFIFF